LLESSSFPRKNLYSLLDKEASYEERLHFLDQVFKVKVVSPQFLFSLITFSF